MASFCWSVRNTIGTRDAGRRPYRSDALATATIVDLDGSLRRGDLPEETGRVDRLVQAVAFGFGEDLGRRMYEDLELSPGNSQREVAERQHRSCPPCSPRKAHHQDLSRVVCGGTGQHRHVGIAADDAVHDHDVGDRDLTRRLREIRDLAFDAVFEPRLTEQLERHLLVGGGQLDADRPGYSGLQELDLDRADAAADLEQRPAFYASLLQVVDDSPRG